MISVAYAETMQPCNNWSIVIATNYIFNAYHSLPFAYQCTIEGIYYAFRWYCFISCLPWLEILPGSVLKVLLGKRDTNIIFRTGCSRIESWDNLNVWDSCFILDLAACLYILVLYSFCTNTCMIVNQNCSKCFLLYIIKNKKKVRRTWLPLWASSQAHRL